MADRKFNLFSLVRKDDDLQLPNGKVVGAKTEADKCEHLDKKPVFRYGGLGPSRRS